jgi:hypothetical protein
MFTDIQEQSFAGHMLIILFLPPYCMPLEDNRLFNITIVTKCYGLDSATCSNFQRPIDYDD